MQLIDTHCHIHDTEFFSFQEAEKVLESAITENVDTMLMIGTSLKDSQAAVNFARQHSKHCWASVGVHPHEALKFTQTQLKNLHNELIKIAKDPKVVAIGECGLDFYYNDRLGALKAQQQLLEVQLAVASEHKLPTNLHIREAFTDFWPIFDNFPGLRGVVHSFTDSPKQLEAVLKRKLCIGINGIATFTTHAWQKELYRTVSLESFVLETDAPFLTPHPKRGKINEPKNVIYITDFLAELRGDDAKNIALHTTNTARNLFGF